MKNDRFDQAMAISNLARQLREARVSLEYRISLAVWAGLGVFVFKPVNANWLLVVVFVALVFGLHFYWVYKNYLSNETNAGDVYKYLDICKEIVTGEAQPAYRRPSRNPMSHPGPLLQVLATGLLGAAVVATSTADMDQQRRAPPADVFQALVSCHGAARIQAPAADVSEVETLVRNCMAASGYSSIKAKTGPCSPVRQGGGLYASCYRAPRPNGFLAR